MSCTILANLRNPEFSISNSEFLSIQEAVKLKENFLGIFKHYQGLIETQNPNCLFKVLVQEACQSKDQLYCFGVASTALIDVLTAMRTFPGNSILQSASPPEPFLQQLVYRVLNRPVINICPETFCSVLGEMNNFDSMVRCSITRPPNSNVVIIAIAILGLFFAQCCNCSSFPSHPFPTRSEKHFCFKLPLPEPAMQQFSILP